MEVTIFSPRGEQLRLAILLMEVISWGSGVVAWLRFAAAQFRL